MAGGATTPELVAAVSNAGGLGSLGAGYMPADELRLAIHRVRTLTTHPFAVNLFIPETYHESTAQMHRMQQRIEASCSELLININLPNPPYLPDFNQSMNVVLEERVPVFSFTFGIPNIEWIKRLKSHGTILIGTATHLEEAHCLAAQGIDMIVAQGSEAGGHRGTFIGNPEDALIPIRELLKQCVQAVKIPIIAAGGIMTAAVIKEIRSLGASGVQLGTAFLSCPESGIHPAYKKALLAATYNNTVLTRAFSGKLARGIQNTFITRMQSETTLDYPIQNTLTKPMRKAAEQQSNSEFMSLWAGEGLHFSQALPARQLVQQLMIISNET